MQHHALDDFGQAQHGLITLDQLRSAYTRKRIATLRRGAAIELLHPKVFRIVGTRADWLQEVHACVLAVPGSVASHFTAARMWKLYAPPGTPIEITAAPNLRPRLRNVRSHKTDILSACSYVDGIPVTPPERTLIDIAHYCRADWMLKSALESALYLDLVTLRTVRREIDRIAEHGRTGVAPLRELVDEYSPEDDKTKSPLELRTLRGLRAAGLPEPVKQHHVVANGHDRYLDFAYPDLKIGIEAHGRDFHARLTKLDKDTERDADLRDLDWQIHYVTTRNFDTAIERIHRRVNAASRDIPAP